MIVNLSFLTSHQWDIDHSLYTQDLLEENYYPYVNLAKEIYTQRKNVTFRKCPAHTDFLKNMFALIAPFDLTIEIDISNDKQSIYCENLTQNAFNELIDFRFLDDYDKVSSSYPLIGIDWLNVFTCDQSLVLQVFPAFFHDNDFTSKTTVIPGQFDISKWTRPVELVFEVKKSKEKIKIKKGDAVLYFKFNTDKIVKLVKADTPWEEIKTCNQIRTENTFRPLTERYESLEQVRKMKCPFKN